MKTFKQYIKEISLTNEDLGIEEIDVISDVVKNLESISSGDYDSIEDCISDIKETLDTLGLTFDIDPESLKEGESVEIPLVDDEGEDVRIAIENELDGDIMLKLTKSSDKKIKAEILVYFDDDVVKSLSDIEFEVAVDDADDDLDEEEEDEEEIDEEVEEVPEEEPQQEQSYEDYLKLAVEARMKELQIDDEEKMMAAVDILMAEIDSVLETPQEEEPVEIDGEELEPEEPSSSIEIHEEATVGANIYNVILYKPSTSRYQATIIYADNDSGLEKKVKELFPDFIIYDVYLVNQQADYSQK